MSLNPALVAEAAAFFEKLDKFQGESSFYTWVYRIAVNEAHNRRRWLHRKTPG